MIRGNQSIGDLPYDDKLDHILRENMLAQSLHPHYYDHNPNFLKPEMIQLLGFQPHEHMLQEDVEQRAALVERICRQIWASVTSASSERRPQ